MFLFLVEPAAETLRSPVTTFVLLLAIVLAVPPIFERLKLPGLVGLLAAGVLFGGSGLGWLKTDSETMKLFSEIGKIYLMFVAGLEIDLALFKQTRNKSMGYGFMTFAIPFVGGVGVGLVFGYGLLAAVLIGSLLASHTLLAYPIVQRLGVVDDEAVTVTVGATIFTDIGSLLVLAICLGINSGDFSIVKLATLLGSLILYAIAVLYGLNQLGKIFFRQTGKDEGNQFLFVMLSVFLAAVCAQLIGVENIIGAFLAGLAINNIVGNGPVKEKTEFLGSVLFIPMFFIYMGLLLDLDAFGSIVRSINVPLSIVAVLLITKAIAALGAKQFYGYSSLQTLTMWSLSIPQVAATLAAALVGYEAEIINSQVFNSIILLMLVTAILGPLVTANAAQRLALQEDFESAESVEWLPLPTEIPDAYSVVVPIYNSESERSLLELAAAVTRDAKSRIMPLSIARAQPQMDSPQLSRALARSRHQILEVEAISDELKTAIEPKLRVDYNVAQAICHLSREEDANLIILGMPRKAQIRKRIRLSRSPSGTIQERVMWSAHCPVVAARLLEPISEVKRILVPIEQPSVAMLRVLRLAQVLAQENKAQVMLMHICSPRTSALQQARIEKQLQILLDKLPSANRNIDIQVRKSDRVVATIVREAGQHDLVMLRSQRRRVGDLLTIGKSTAPLLEQLSGSVILVGEPHPQRAPKPIRQKQTSAIPATA